MIGTIVFNYCKVQPKHQQAGNEVNYKLQSRQTVRWTIKQNNNFRHFIGTKRAIRFCFSTKPS